MRKPVMAGNWKMYKTPGETTAFFEQFLPLVKDAEGREIVICPPLVDLAAAVKATGKSNVSVGGQNIYWEKEGAYTGEVSGAMLKAAGANWVIIGHSERRQFFGETDETVKRRTVAAIAAGLKPIVCIGELLADREAGRTNAVLEDQCSGGIAPLTPEEFEQVTIAYEPVWAIGTGKTATPDMAEDAHRVIRKLISDAFGTDLASRTGILYGGSVKPDNAKTLMAQENVDGVLVGGASLDPGSFASIVNY